MRCPATIVTDLNGMELNDYLDYITNRNIFNIALTKCLIVLRK